ncbi:hypothetical protein KKB40_01715 [Patescibacteria group bacterium]|nr:hypothetical protein [Patescibacteria group bacterium]
MSNTLLRTQIYLPQDLRREIDRQRDTTGESLVEYLRKAAEVRIKKDRKKRFDLRKLADDVVGSVKKGGWTGINVENWQRKIREDEDKHFFKKNEILT